ncbi:MAG: hypothetical protein H8D23_10860 [Candidatus Brocadiales bacterium]|nr:hypothetical protein [Candidatus Brocadiales bacterium]
MQVLEVKELPNGDFEYEIDLTDEEREMIKKAKGWKRLTKARIQTWFLETLNNTIEKEK